jgi:hypothetical protein
MKRTGWGPEARLAETTDWVRSEFENLLAFTNEAGCEGREARGPGLTLVLGTAVVVRLHPTLTYLNVGFPNAMREDVATLTHALRDQRGEAWLHYRPDVCDRDTIQTLITKSAHAATMRSRHLVDSTPAAPPHQSPLAGGKAGAMAATVSTETSARDDLTDLRLILGILRAFRIYEDTTGSPAPIKAIREAIYFHWEQPRLPPGNQVLAVVPPYAGCARTASSRTPGRTRARARDPRTPDDQATTSRAAAHRGRTTHRA